MFSTGSIKESLAKFFKLESLTEDLSGYVETRIELLKLEVREEIAKAISKVVLLGLIVLLIIMILTFFSIGAAFFINQYFTQKYIGFFLVGGFYLTLLLLGFLLRIQLFHTLEKLLSRHFKNHKG